MEQFVSATASRRKPSPTLKGQNDVRTGPGQPHTAKEILAKNGLKEGDYTIDQLDMSQHINADDAARSTADTRLNPTPR